MPISTVLSLLNLVAILAAAILAPIIANRIPRVRLPVVLLEIGLGVVVGPQLLGIARVDAVANLFSQCGLAFLFFLAGFEVDLKRIWGRPLAQAWGGWLLSFALALGLAAVTQHGGVLLALLYVALATSTTGIGSLMPILHDAGELRTPFGTHILAAGAAGQFGPILVLALANHERSPGEGLLALGAFFAVSMAITVIARRWRPARLTQLLQTTLHTSGQLATRLPIGLIAALVLLAEALGINMLLGAFTAGIIVAQVVGTVGAAQHAQVEIVRAKYEAIGYGLLIPIFFVTSGMNFELRSLLVDPLNLLLIPGFMICFLLARGLPALLLYRRDLSSHDRRSLALLSATQLSLVIVVTRLGVAAGALTASTAAALVGAGMSSVFLFPLLALAQRNRSGNQPAALDAAVVVIE